MGSPVNVITSKTTKNYCINGQFDFFQRRGTPSWVNEGNLYTADRWFRFKQTGGGTGVFTNIQDAGLGNGSRSLKIGRPSGATDVNQTEIIQALESKDSVELSGKKITLSFKLRKGANFSGSQVNFYIGYGTGSDQGVISAWSGQGVISGTPILAGDLNTTTYYQVKLTTILPTINQLRFDINYVPTGTAGANDWIEITEVMLNEGEFVPYVRHGGSYPSELRSCQRYYEKSYPIGISPGTSRAGAEDGLFMAVIDTNTIEAMATNGQFKIQKRNDPAVVIYSYSGTVNKTSPGITGTDSAGGSSFASRIDTLGFGSIDGFSGAGYSPGRPIWYCWTADAEL